jgi:hypothetical protein
MTRSMRSTLHLYSEIANAITFAGFVSGHRFSDDAAVLSGTRL